MHVNNDSISNCFLSVRNTAHYGLVFLKVDDTNCTSCRRPGFQPMANL